MAKVKGKRSSKADKRATVTVRDVAKEADVHPGTVSRVLNSHTQHLISPETIARVQAAAKNLGYEPNRLASALRTRRSMSVGVIISDLTNPLFPPLVRGLEDELAELDYTALIANTDSDVDRERRAFETLAARQVDGLVMATSPASEGLVAQALDNGTPVVLVNRGLDDKPCYAVTPDDANGAALVADHLADLGHTAIAHLAGPQDVLPGRARYEAFAKALDRRGLSLPDERVAFAKSFTQGAGTEPTRQLLEKDQSITAIFAANDLLALDCIDELATAGRQVPDDVSVVGFNDMPFADRFSPPLTTVHFSYYDVGVRAAQLLLEQLAGGADDPRTDVVETSLVVRGSSAKR
jgi:LacI family transcriptional regulator, galactose operon repressor